MAWILSLLSLLSFMLLCFTKSVALGFISMLMTVGFMLAAIVVIFSSRVEGASRDSGHLLTPEELREYREKAQAKRNPPVAGAPSENRPGPDTPPPPASP
jgi:hypothetical protein